MPSDSSITDRRSFVSATAALIATAALVPANAVPVSVGKPKTKAVAFDAFAIFDPRPVFRQLEELFPGQGSAMSEQWRTRQFEYTWLRNSMRNYTDFWHVTQDALNYAARQSGIDLRAEDRAKLMAAYTELKPWPDVPATLRTLCERGFRLALLSNMTPAMMLGCVKASGLETAFEFQLSTDRVQVFKPDPAAYKMGTDAFGLRKEEIAFVAFGSWDAAGARRFGYPTFWANRNGVQAEELGTFADANHPDLSQLSGFIDSL